MEEMEAQIQGKTLHNVGCARLVRRRLHTGKSKTNDPKVFAAFKATLSNWNFLTKVASPYSSCLSLCMLAMNNPDDGPNWCSVERLLLSCLVLQKFVQLGQVARLRPQLLIGRKMLARDLARQFLEVSKIEIRH